MLTVTVPIALLSSKDCPKWKKEAAIQLLCTESGFSYGDAYYHVVGGSSGTMSTPGSTSYSTVVAKQLSFSLCILTGHESLPRALSRSIIQCLFLLLLQAVVAPSNHKHLKPHKHHSPRKLQSPCNLHQPGTLHAN